MAKVTIISGPQGSGKTTFIRELTDGKRTHNILYNEEPNWYSLEDFIQEAEVLVIEECTNPLEVAKEMSSLKSVKIRRPYTKSTVKVKIPEVIIETQVPLIQEPTRPGITVITLPNVVK